MGHRSRAPRRRGRRRGLRRAGRLILYQIENEYASFTGSPTGVNYIARLYAKVRADGIAVHILHNDKGRNGYWTPGSFPAPDANYLYAFDAYPSASGAPPDWGCYRPGGAKGAADTPGFEAEFGGGYFDPWGGAPALLTGRPGTGGETVLRYAARPAVSVLAGRAGVTSSWNSSSGDLVCP